MTKARIRLDRLDRSAMLADEGEYEQRLGKLQRKLLAIQQAYLRDRRRAIVVFEGWDASGKGGAIQRLTERLDPRRCKVWPIAAPTAEEQGRHYLYRFWQRLPEPGTIAVFDRSWYGRVLVERVDGLIAARDWKRAYKEINEFENILVDDGVRLIKIFLHIGAKEQLRRFAERIAAPHKRWKIALDDFHAHGKRKAYKNAYEDMFDRNSTANARWHVIPADHKWHARVTALEIVVAELSRGVDLSPMELDPALLREARKVLGRGAL
ncbi:MAG: polyphosphate kinase [Alphaproteobacteria bacterium]|nr:polyphosphate kinase [Alphaproteobacteria bacterium]